MKTLFIAGLFAASAALSGCATTAEPPTPEQRAACEKMLADMGDGATHSHSSDKSGAANPMAMTHAQCRRMLAK